MPALQVDTTINCWDMFNPEQHKLSCCHCLDCTDKDRCLLSSSPASVCFSNVQDRSVQNTKQSKLYPKSPSESIGTHRYKSINRSFTNLSIIFTQIYIKTADLYISSLGGRLPTRKHQPYHFFQLSLLEK